MVSPPKALMIRSARVTVCDDLPAGLQMLSAPDATVHGRRICWDVGFLRSGRHETEHLTALVTSAAPDGQMRNVATVAGVNAGRVKDAAVVNVRRREPHVPAVTG
jgi:hypothetical protein